MPTVGSDHIHKLIDPLFLDSLRAELDRCDADRDRLIEFQSKLGALTFLDPACGTGNFLLETFLSLRRLENEIIRRLPQLSIRVSIEQFFGIELDDSACTIARTALALAEQQMLQALDQIIPVRPSNHSARIVCGNALRLDWYSIVPTADFMSGNDTRAAFVSTNSITRGEQVAPLWQTAKLILDTRARYPDRSLAHRGSDRRETHDHASTLACLGAAVPRAPIPD